MNAWITSGQIIATSHDLGPQNVAKEGKWDPLFQENPGEGEIFFLAR